jgi:hypothetical protein
MNLQPRGKEGQEEPFPSVIAKQLPEYTGVLIVTHIPRQCVLVGIWEMVRKIQIPPPDSCTSAYLYHTIQCLSTAEEESNSSSAY